jgi:hypothetical protein
MMAIPDARRRKLATVTPEAAAAAAAELLGMVRGP